MCPTHPRSHAHRPIFSLTTPTINSKTTKTKRQKETNNNFSPFFFFFFAYCHPSKEEENKKRVEVWYWYGMVGTTPFILFFWSGGVIF
jgi:hypothetical protein